MNLPARSSSRRGMHATVVTDLGQRIIRGELAPGEVVNPIQLEHDLGVSRTVVREALRVLAAKGLVDARPKKGTFIRPREEWSLLDADVMQWQVQNPDGDGFLANLAEVRSIVEPAAARLAAQRHTQADIDLLSEALDAMRDPNASAEQTIHADLAFHRALLASTHNELLQQMEQIIETGLRVRGLLVQGRGEESDIVAAHRPVLDTVAARDPDRAEDAYRSLLEQADRDVEAVRSSEAAPTETVDSDESHVR